MCDQTNKPGPEMTATDVLNRRKDLRFGDSWLQGLIDAYLDAVWPLLREKARILSLYPPTVIIGADGTITTNPSILPADAQAVVDYLDELIRQEGHAAIYRPPTPLERAFSEDPTASIINRALRHIGNSDHGG